MKLEKWAIEEFREIYYLEYGIKLDYKEAEKLARRFYNQMTAVYRPIPKLTKRE